MTAKNNIWTDHEKTEERLKKHFGTSSPFSAPEGYFDEFPARMLEKARSIEGKTPVSKSLHPLFRRMAVAASILIIAGLAIVLMLLKQEPATVPAEEFTFMEVYRYNFGNLAELEEAYILSLAGEEASDDIFSVPVDTTGITQEDMIEYLLAENHIEYLTLNNN